MACRYKQGYPFSSLEAAMHFSAILLLNRLQFITEIISIDKRRESNCYLREVN